MNESDSLILFLDNYLVNDCKFNKWKLIKIKFINSIKHIRSLFEAQRQVGWYFVL
jgi:hypothetical protein